VGRYGRRPPFELISFCVTSGWNNGSQARGTRKLNGVSVDITTLTVNTSGTLETFDWDNQVVFHSFGGANAGINGQGTEFVPDNLTTSPAVFDQRPLARRPEPSTLALLCCLGSHGLGDAARLRAGAPHWPPSTGAECLPAEASRQRPSSEHFVRHSSRHKEAWIEWKWRLRRVPREQALADGS